MPGFVGIPELLLLGLVVLLVFGPKRLPDVGRSLGKGLREFKDSIGGSKDEEDRFEIPAELLEEEPVDPPARLRERERVA